MATKIRDIIDYYSGHNVPDEIKERVLDRISNTQDDKEANEAFRELWDKADSAYMEEEEISAAYNRLFETEETREIEKKKSLRIFNFAKLAAVFVPLLILIVFGKLYVQMNNQLKDIKLVTMLQEHTINEESKVIALADGTKVRLSQSSVLLYPSSFKGAEERKVSCRERHSSTSGMMMPSRSTSALLISRLPTWAPLLRFHLIQIQMKYLPHSKPAR